MARDYKNSVTRNKSKERPVGSWLSFLSGLTLGLFVALIVYYWGDQIRVGDASIAEEDDSGYGTSYDSGLAVVPRDDDTGGIMPKLRYEFYKILPEIEVKVPDWEFLGNRPEKKEALPPGKYVLQIGSFRRHADADRAKAELALRGIKANIQKVVINGQDVWHRVHIGPFQEVSEIKAMRRQLVENDMDFILLQINDSG